MNVCCMRVARLARWSVLAPPVHLGSRPCPISQEPLLVPLRPVNASVHEGLSSCCARLRLRDGVCTRATCAQGDDCCDADMQLSQRARTPLPLHNKLSCVSHAGLMLVAPAPAASMFLPPNGASACEPQGEWVQSSKGKGDRFSTGTYLILLRCSCNHRPSHDTDCRPAIEGPHRGRFEPRRAARLIAQLHLDRISILSELSYHETIAHCSSRTPMPIQCREFISDLRHASPLL